MMMVIGSGSFSLDHLDSTFCGGPEGDLDG